MFPLDEEVGVGLRGAVLQDGLDVEGVRVVDGGGGTRRLGGLDVEVWSELAEMAEVDLVVAVDVCRIIELGVVVEGFEDLVRAVVDVGGLLVAGALA